jgi:hypothetical protein
MQTNPEHAACIYGGMHYDFSNDAGARAAP